MVTMMNSATITRKWSPVHSPYPQTASPLDASLLVRQSPNTSASNAPFTFIFHLRQHYPMHPQIAISSSRRATRLDFPPALLVDSHLHSLPSSYLHSFINLCSSSSCLTLPSTCSIYDHNTNSLTQRTRAALRQHAPDALLGTLRPPTP